jgi:hypothetical protein
MLIILNMPWAPRNLCRDVEVREDIKRLEKHGDHDPENVAALGI